MNGLVHDQKQYPGNGIGLSTVKRAAQKMGGSAGVFCEFGIGSTFWIELPSRQQAPGEKKFAAAVPMPAASKMMPIRIA